MEEVGIREIPRFPNLSVRLRNNATMAAFENLIPEIVHAGDGVIALRCMSTNKLVLFFLGLDFAYERLEYDPEKGVGMVDDGSVDSITNALDHVSLIKGLILNGQLEVWDYEKNLLLCRCDPNIPVNIDTIGTIANLDNITLKLNSEIASRSNKDRA